MERFASNKLLHHQCGSGPGDFKGGRAGENEEKKVCPACGRGFSCGVRAGRCWCMELPALEHPPPYRDCLCPDCLRAWSAAEAGG
ncbi:MAG: cysteine-rich CWC family protein [Azovibrio sp.]|uniref:cysteine-rich CWC family protein n=1 Tax=Azovibrio sp. TaxID=1872673 RepID=UPI003C7282A1